MNTIMILINIITNKQYRNLKLLKYKLIKYSISKIVKMGIKAYKWNWTEMMKPRPRSQPSIPHRILNHNPLRINLLHLLPSSLQLIFYLFSI